MRILRTFKTLCVGFVASATLLASHQEGALQEPTRLTISRAAAANSLHVPQEFIQAQLARATQTEWNGPVPTAERVSLTVNGKRITAGLFAFERNGEWIEHLRAQLAQEADAAYQDVQETIGALFLDNKINRDIAKRPH
ncbi:MAG: hypothetical protein C0514_00735 [Candidatus Puniceispirillum sp.]|nr:hypothetical protein [Candidatus Puniceispirillum sp.]